MQSADADKSSALGSTFQIGIIGGGLAGLALAIQMGKLGYKVVLFEKEKYPFHKVCGEYISMESWDFLVRLGVPLDEMALPRLKRLRISEPGGEMFDYPISSEGFGISRYRLDACLAGLAREAGVTVLEKTRVKGIRASGPERSVIETGGGAYEVAVVCGSYGKYANLDLLLERGFIAPERRKLAFSAVKYHVDLDFPDDLIALHNFDGGYCGMSRIEDGRTCLCYLVRADKLKAAGSIPALEREVLRRNPHLDDVFGRARSLYDQPLAITQIHFSPKPPVEQHVLMLGDAAGMIPPLSGNGMSMALRASSLLAPLLHDFLQQRLDRAGLEAGYARVWRRSFGVRLLTGKVLQHLFGKPGPATWLIKSVKPFPRLIDQVVTLTHGERF